jgi:hypothetical protein
MQQYWEFMNRPPSMVATSAVEHHASFWTWAVQSSVFFCVLNWVITPITKFLLPKFHSALTAKEQQEYPAYLACLVHHAVVVPYAVTHIYADIMRENSLSHNYAETEGWVVAYTFGYMVGDTVFFALWEALRGEFEFLFHHVLSMGLVAAVASLPGPTDRFIPHVMLCELSQLFFVAAWFLRLVKFRNGTIILILEAIFAVMFVLTRNINFLVATIKILGTSGHWCSVLSQTYVLFGVEFSGPYLNLMRALLFPMNILQFYWFTKIVRGILALFKPDRNMDDKAK